MKTIIGTKINSVHRPKVYKFIRNSITTIHFTLSIIISLKNWKSLLHPVIMTILFLPFAYMLALYMTYEVLFIRVDFLTRDKKVARRLKRQIILTANLNIERLNRISKNLNIVDFTSDDLKGFVKQIGG